MPVRDGVDPGCLSRTRALGVRGYVVLDLPDFTGVVFRSLICCSSPASSSWRVVLPISAGASSAAWYVLGICTSSTT